MPVQSLGQEEALEEGTAGHSSILAWRIPWTEEPGRLRPTVSQRSDMTEATSHVPTCNAIRLTFDIVKFQMNNVYLCIMGKQK